MKQREIRLIFVWLIVAFGAMFVDEAVSQDPIGYTMSSPNHAEQGIFSLFALMRQGATMMNTSYNLDNDSSLQKYVSIRKPYDDVYYIPAELVELDTSYIITRTTKPLLRPEAARALTTMAKDFYIEFNKKFVLISAYRSYQDQKRLVGEWCSRARCAQAGTSEHQSGLASDLAVGNDKWGIYSISDKKNKYYKWLENNAHKYGFHNTFQKWIDVDGQMEEGWHWRYLGKWLATFLYENGWTLGEYYTRTQENLVQ